MKNFQIFSLATIVALLITACGSSSTPIPTVSVSETPRPSEPPTITATASPTPTRTLTPTSLPPMVVVGGVVPCYSEPGTEFAQVATFDLKMDIEVIGKNSDETFLMGKTPNNDNSCWIESQFTT